MSYPPAPGTGTSSLPPRPPPSIHQPPTTTPTATTTGKSAAAAVSSASSLFSGFRPRQVATPAAAPGTTGSYPGAPGAGQPNLRYSATYAGSGPQSAAAPGVGAYAAQKPAAAAASFSKQPYLSYSHTYAGAPTVNPNYQQQPQQQQAQAQPQQHHAQQQPHHQPHHQTQQQQQQQQQQQHHGYQQSAGYGPTGYNSAGTGHGYDQHQHQQHQQQHHGQNRGGYNRHNQYNSGLDPELEAQIAEQQSIYDPAKRATLAAAAATNPAGAAGAAGPIGPYDPNAATTADGSTPPETGAPKPKPNATVKRSGGGQSWTDDTLLEWNPAHFRLFVGNLAGEVTDDSLLKAFAAYPSVSKARVIRDKRTTKSKGYGFVAFEDGDDYFRAAKEMQGKYIGSHPVLLRKSTTEIKATSLNKKNKNKNKNKNKDNNGMGGNGMLGKKSGDGVKKKDKGPKLLG